MKNGDLLTVLPDEPDACVISVVSNGPTNVRIGQTPMCAFAGCGHAMLHALDGNRGKSGLSRRKTLVYARTYR
jgi:hypothetical protein